MTTILSPTRGGERSYPNQDYAIQLAKQRGADLLFLHVSDIQFLNHRSSPILIDVVAELEEMGEFLLAMAQERAAKAGVQAQTVVRSGVFREVLSDLIPQFEIATLILGSSEEEPGHTTSEFLVNLSQEMVRQHGLEVLLVSDGALQASFADSA